MEKTTGTQDQQWNTTGVTNHSFPRQEEKKSDTVEPPHKTVHMPQMSFMDATYHATQDLFYALHNTAHASPLVKLGHGHK